MKTRYGVFLSVVAALLLSAMPGGIIHAYPPCGPFSYPGPESFCRPYFLVSNSLVIVIDTVPAAQLRDGPFTDAAVLAKLAPGSLLRLSSSCPFSGMSWDSRQWWWCVETVQGTDGWIEHAVIDNLPVVYNEKIGFLPVPYMTDPPAIYLLINAQRRHVADWDTFLNLGYKSSDIVSLQSNNDFRYLTPAEAKVQMDSPEGTPITRLLKGSDAPVYWMENGFRRHIPDMATFEALGFHTSDITVLPDSILALWPLGAPLPSR